MKPIPIGSDLVSREGERIVVDAARDMPDWEVRKARRAQIQFRDRVYFVASRVPGARGRVTFLLEPWPEKSTDVPGARLVYDREYVRRRDQEVGLARVGMALQPLLVSLTPLVGFLPSATKRRLHTALGIHPVRATRWSVYLEGAVVLLLGTYLTIMAFVAGLGGAAAIGFGMFAQAVVQMVLTLDLVFRVASLIRGTLDQDGAYEWLFRPLVKLLRRR